MSEEGGDKGVKASEKDVHAPQFGGNKNTSKNLKMMLMIIIVGNCKNR